MRSSVVSLVGICLILLNLPEICHGQSTTSIQGETYVYQGGSYRSLPDVRIYLLRDGNYLGNPNGRQFWQSDKQGRYIAIVKSGAPVRVVYHLSSEFVPEVHFLAARPNDRNAIHIGLIRVVDYEAMRKQNPTLPPLAQKLKVVEDALPKNDPLANEIFAMRKTAENKEHRVRLLVPAYFYPGGLGLKEWEKLIATTTNENVSVWAIVNPASGPGVKVDPNYKKILKRAVKAGIRLLGYVHTNYGDRPFAEVKKDLEQWHLLYPEIDGIFVDTMSNKVAKVDFYQKFYQEINKVFVNPVVVGNPGTLVPESYVKMPTADVICLFENAQDTIQNKIKTPPWASKYPQQEWSALIYKTDEAKMDSLAADLLKEKIRYVYITDEYQVNKVLNPWTRLPSYWPTEVYRLQRLVDESSANNE